MFEKEGKDVDYGSPVRIKERTKRELKKYGSFGESYDELIWKLLKSYRQVLKLKMKKTPQQKWLEKNRVSLNQ